MIVAVTITSLNKDHLNQILELERECFSDPWTENMFFNELENPLTFYCAALCKKQVVGYGGMWRVIDEGHITSIAVAPAYRNKGIGRLLLNKLKSNAHRHKIKTLSLEVRVSNAAAISLYTQSGFVITGLRKNYYSDNEDAVLMDFNIEL